MNNVRSLIEDFANQLAALVEAQALDQARAAIEGALGIRRPGRPPKAAPLALTAELGTLARKTRKKPPKQFCPVPGCKNAAAPVFGMVCVEHKDVAKAKIKQYREARKAKKLGIKPPKAAKSKPAKAAKARTKRPAKAAKARTKKPARPRTQPAAKARPRKVARRKPAKRQPTKVEAPAPVATPKPPAAAAA
jgi:hypothetical protein